MFSCIVFLLMSSGVVIAEVVDGADTLSLSDLLNLDINTVVDVASLFMEEEMVVGSTVSSIKAKDWTKRGARTFYEALDNEPSMMFYPDNFGTRRIGIRGFQSGKGISFLLDGIPQNNAVHSAGIYRLRNFQLGILDRIEVLKGPGSAIYGSDAFHGVIALKTFESDEDYYSFEARGADPTFYSDGNVKISQGFGDNLVRIDTALSFSNQSNEKMAYDNIGPGPGVRKNQYSDFGGVFKTTINPADKLKIKLGAYANILDHEGFPGVNFNNDIYGFDQDYGSKSEDYNGSASIIYDLKEYNITVETLGYCYEYTQDPMKYAGYIPSLKMKVYVDGSESNLGRGGKVLIKQSSNKINLQWVVGYEYLLKKCFDTGSLIKLENDFVLKDGVQETEDKFHEINSAFAQTKWGLIDNQLFLLAGGRYDHYQTFGDHLTPRAGLIFLPTKQSSVKALYGSAFIAPSIQNVADAGGSSDIKPETIDTYELIYIQKGNDWKINITGFYSVWKNSFLKTAITADVDQSLEAGYQQQQQFAKRGENSSHGCEIMGIILRDPFEINLGFSYAKGKSHNVEDITNPAITEDKEYDTIPTYSIISGITYKLKPVNVNFYLNNRVYTNWKDATPAPQRPVTEGLATYWRTDLDITKVFENDLEISLGVRNLLNRSNFVPSVWGFAGGYEEPGISAMLRVNYKI